MLADPLKPANLIFCQVLTLCLKRYVVLGAKLHLHHGLYVIIECFCGLAYITLCTMSFDQIGAIYTYRDEAPAELISMSKPLLSKDILPKSGYEHVWIPISIHQTQFSLILKIWLSQLVQSWLIQISQQQTDL